MHHPVASSGTVSHRWEGIEGFSRQCLGPFNISGEIVYRTIGILFMGMYVLEAEQSA